MKKNGNKNKNKNKILKRSKYSIPESQFSEVTKKDNNSLLKEVNVTINNKDGMIKKTLTNQLYDGATSIDESKSKNSFYLIKSKPKKCYSFKFKKNNKKDMNKILNLLKNNKKIKIPSGKGIYNINNNNNINIYVKRNLNSNEKNIESIEAKPEKNARLDTYGNKIFKGNKKNIHIRFLDNIDSNKLIDIIPIQSFKKFNIIEEIPDEKYISNFNKCCKIF